MDEPGLGTASYTVSVCATATVTAGFASVNELEQAIVEATRAAGRQLYVEAFRALQEDWLAWRRDRFTAQRWRTLQWLTPFGAVALPVRVVRQKASGRPFPVHLDCMTPAASAAPRARLNQPAPAPPNSSWSPPPCPPALSPRLPRPAQRRRRRLETAVPNPLPADPLGAGSLAYRPSRPRLHRPPAGGVSPPDAPPLGRR